MAKHDMVASSMNSNMVNAEHDMVARSENCHVVSAKLDMPIQAKGVRHCYASSPKAYCKGSSAQHLGEPPGCR